MKNIKLSILIPTHNRPKYFERCLNSVISQLNDETEIIVNNDSNDIIEISHPQVKYFYNKFNSLCEIYEFLLSQSIGDYVYYLEDDDYLASNFFNIPLDSDMIVGNYYPTYSNKHVIQFSTIYKDDLIDSNKFLEKLNKEDLQLSQHIYKRDLIKDFMFPKDSNINNDILLTIHAAEKSQTIRTVNKVLYYQTVDAGDNISFL